MDSVPVMTSVVREPAVELSADRIAEACAAAWQRLGESVQRLRLTGDQWSAEDEDPADLAHDAGTLHAVLVPALRRVELVLDEQAPFAAVRHDLSRWLESGWEVSALTPLDRLGEAHTTLRGLALVLQGCWLRDSQVRFTSGETP
ncbi:hypothetical protein ASG41_20980 [Modestobacter sp. Leaf380]|nr:hypothetical protein ASG41_20980 [Modestobacter sp. Leaf380]